MFDFPREEPVNAAEAEIIRKTQRELELACHELIASAENIRDDMKSLTDWRKPIRKHPFIFLGSAFTLGLLVATGGHR